MKENIWSTFVIVTTGFILGAFLMVKVLMHDFPQIKDSKIRCLEMNLGKEVCDKIFNG